jgi:CARDB/Bacterial Ig domain
VGALRLAVFIVITILISQPAGSAEVSDPRFFGTFCGSDVVRACGSFCLTPWGPCFQRCRNVQIENIFVAVQYKDRPQGPGSILGSGTATVEGRALKLNVSAVVTGLGRAQGVVASNRFDAEPGSADLANDGVTLTVSARGQSIRLSKERCGNAFPVVKITVPTNGASLVFRTPTLFRGDVTDDRDVAFPRERLSLVSDRDGPLVGAVNAQPRSLEISTDRLSPGQHRITFLATDSGGLTSSASITVSVADRLRYAAKFICGKAPQASAAPGIYFTAINVYNPSDGPISFQKRFTVGMPEQKTGPVTRYRPTVLDAGRALRVECPEILRTVGGDASFLEGFVVIESPETLNIVAAYSAGGQSGFVETLHVQPIAGIRLPVKLPDLVVEGGCDLSVRVRNVGTADAGASTTKLVIGRQVFNLPTPPINAGGTATLPPVNAPHSGDFGYMVTADSEDQVLESSEANNVAVVNCIG